MNIYEVLGFITATVGVWLAARENNWTWPVSMVGTLFQMYVYYQVRLYADLGLNAFYFVTSFYGWYSWSHGAGPDQARVVTRTRGSQWLILFLLVVLFTAGLGYYLSHYTRADLSYLDSAATAVSLAAYWLQARKKLENWLIWLVVDAGYVGIYLYKELYVFAALYFIFLILAGLGYAQWRRAYQRAQTNEALTFLPGHPAN